MGSHKVDGGVSQIWAANLVGQSWRAGVASIYIPQSLAYFHMLIPDEIVPDTQSQKALPPSGAWNSRVPRILHGFLPLVLYADFFPSLLYLWKMTEKIPVCTF